MVASSYPKRRFRHKNLLINLFLAMLVVVGVFILAIAFSEQSFYTVLGGI